jgi:cell division transport system permease protein
MFLRLCKYGVKNILRNKFLSISSVLVLSLLMFFVNILMILHNLSNHLIESVNSKLTISLYLKDEYQKDSPDTIRLMEQINKNFPTIFVDFKTKDEALEEMRKKDPWIVEIVKNENPLPSTISLSNIKIEQYQSLNETIESKSFILSDFRANSTFDYRSQYLRIQKILSILTALKLALYIIIWVFVAAIFVITYSIIGNFIYHYRDEIYITRLVGWSNGFIYGPFVIQGMIYAFLGFFLSTNIFLFWAKNISFIFNKEQIQNLVFNNYLIEVLFFQFLLFLALWWLSAYVSTRRYMK